MGKDHLPHLVNGQGGLNKPRKQRQQLQIRAPRHIKSSVHQLVLHTLSCTPETRVVSSSSLQLT